jgi:hypothetical protein
MGAITIFSATAWIRERALLSEYIIRHATQGAGVGGEGGGGLLHNFPWTHAAPTFRSLASLIFHLKGKVLVVK